MSTKLMPMIPLSSTTQDLGLAFGNKDLLFDEQVHFQRLPFLEALFRIEHGKTGGTHVLDLEDLLERRKPDGKARNPGSKGLAQLIVAGRQIDIENP